MTFYWMNFRSILLLGRFSKGESGSCLQKKADLPGSLNTEYEEVQVRIDKSKLQMPNEVGKTKNT
ncbi:MAG: hypothetical protein JJU13_02110 [Balneolaceae bacterium]|nr:hypothetical protein [Balneolaceae bacterium]